MSNTKKVSNAKIVNPILVGSGNMFSQLFFIWTFPFIWTLRQVKDIAILPLQLRLSETADFNDQILDKKWKEEQERAMKEKR